jgi:hypothetical protein
MKLKVNEIYIYYDFPIVFSALDESGNDFLCNYVETTSSHLRYICVPVSPSTLVALEQNKQDLRSLYSDSEKVYNLLLNNESEEFMEVSETKEDITPFLPEKDFYLM